LDGVLKITIFRITQGLLKNIIKHAEAKEVILQLTIEEEGKGFDISK